MNILLLGSGGREHALAWKLTQSVHCSKLFIAPGNPGTQQHGENVPIAIHDFEALASFCIESSVTMVVVGPEEPLVKGIYDFFKNNPATSSIHVIGPSAAAAQLEGSKAFAKAFMQRHQIPTAAYQEFTINNYEAGKLYIRNHALPIVIKADGLAAGKGVIICTTTEEALIAFDQMIQQSAFGDAGKKVVVEAFLEGIELSVFVLTNGKEFVVLPEAKDYKRIGVGDTGLNTGGMGAVSPVPFADKAFMQQVHDTVIVPTIQGLDEEKLVYFGIVFIGLINVKGSPFVIEYNCRFGDPETEVVLPRLENDLVELFLATSQQRLNEIEIITSTEAAATVVLVSGGYPGTYVNGYPVNGLDTISGSLVFHAGTTQNGNEIHTKGGRVFAITSLSDSIKNAVDLSIQNVQKIQFNNKQFRADIGYEFY
ncbi:MAG: phosphoribosylamine--glycine ligase [Ferruginibacter sp.]